MDECKWYCNMHFSNFWLLEQEMTENEWEISFMTVRNITSYNLQFMNDHCRYFKKQSCPVISFHAVLSCSFALEWQSCSFLPLSEFAAIFLSLQCFNTNLTRNGGKVIKCLSFKKILLFVKYAKSWPQNYFLKIVILAGMPCYNSAGMGEIAERWQKMMRYRYCQFNTKSVNLKKYRSNFDTEIS
jgi:hypothetical protein